MKNIFPLFFYIFSHTQYLQNMQAQNASYLSSHAYYVLFHCSFPVSCSITLNKVDYILSYIIKIQLKLEKRFHINI